MAAIYHAGVVEIVPQYDLGNGRRAANVTHWTTAAVGLTAAQLTNVQTAFDNAWKTRWVNVAQASAKYVGSIVRDMSSNLGVVVDNSLYSPVTGSVSASPALGDQVAALISLKGATHYRGGHSRLYIPGLTGQAVPSDGANLSGSAVTAVGQIWSDTVAAMSAVSGTNGGPYQPIIWHKKWSSAPNTTEPILGFVVPTLLATQRRRIRKVSRHKKP